MGPKKKSDQPYIELNLQNNDINILKAKFDGNSKPDCNIKKVKKASNKQKDIKVISWGNSNDTSFDLKKDEKSKDSKKSSLIKDNEQKKAKKKEKNIACTRCRTKHMNCKKIEGKDECLNCLDAAVSCEYQAPKRN